MKRFFKVRQNYLSGFSVKVQPSNILDYTHHAYDEALKDGLDTTKLPLTLPSNAFLIELDYNKDTDYKAVFRFPFNADKDLTLVVRKERHLTKVLTLWLCDKDFNPRKQNSTWLALPR